MDLGMRGRSALFGCALATALLALGALPAAAQDEAESRMRVGLGVGTLGVMVEPSVRLSPSFGVRVPLGGASLNRTEEVEGNAVKGTLRLGGVAVLGDYFPFGAGLRLSGGVLASNFRLSGSTTGSYELDGVEYDGTFAVSAEARNKLNPVVALGFNSGGASAGWSISGDLGLVYTDGLSRTIDATTDNTLVQVQFEEDLAKARQTLTDDLSDLKLLPYVTLAVSFRF